MGFRHLLKPRWRENAGIGTEHIEPAIALRDLRQGLFDGGFRRHIASHAESAMADFLGCRFCRLSIARDDADLGTRLRKNAGNALANAF